MKAKINCRKCGYLFSWTESKYDKKGWKCEGCGNFNDKKNFSIFKAKHFKKYEFCKKCNKLVKGCEIKGGCGWSDFGFKCECGNSWITNWMAYL